MRLHREVLSPARELSGQRMLDFDGLANAVGTIDRKPQVERMIGALDRTRRGRYELISLVAGAECEPHYVLRRLDATLREVDWRHHYSEVASQRIADFRTRVEAVLEGCHTQPGISPAPRPLLINTHLTVGSAEVPHPNVAKQIVTEWRQALDGLSILEGVGVVFCIILKDDTALDHREFAIEAPGLAPMPLGRVPPSDVLAWCESSSLANYLRKNGVTVVRDSRGFDVPAAEWIRDKISRELSASGESMPTMRGAVRLARQSVQAAYDARLANTAIRSRGPVPLKDA
jgi:hypothetical protein